MWDQPVRTSYARRGLLMGKKASRRRGTPTERSTFAAILRECRWHLQQPLPDDVSGAGLNLPSDHYTNWVGLQRIDDIVVRHGPASRAIRIEPEQALALLDWDDSIVGAAEQARPPFKQTYFDFGWLPLGEWELAGAFMFDVGGWSVVGYRRRRGTQDWGKVMVTAEGLKHLSKPNNSYLLSPNEPTDDEYVGREGRLMAGVLLLLESANVDLVYAERQPPKGHQAHGVPHYEVQVRQTVKRHIYPEGTESAARDWSHRWEVRGHFKHFTRGRVFEVNAERRVRMPDGTECVRIWCPPHVKGPQDKPLLPKVRVIA